MALEGLSQREPGMAAQLGAHHTVFPLSAGDSARDLHHQQRGVVEPFDAQSDQNSRWIPQRRRGAEIAISRFAAGRQEVDHADSPWREALNHFTLLWPERMPALERGAP